MEQHNNQVIVTLQSLAQYKIDSVFILAQALSTTSGPILRDTIEEVREQYEKDIKEISHFDKAIRNFESDSNLVFEQYKLLIDSAHKIEERRGGSNNVFIGINTIIVTILMNTSNNGSPNDFIKLVFATALIFIGVLIA